jgi:hypothetical protein
MIKIYLLGHKKFSGKDTLADMMVEKLGYTKLSFAQPVKDLARDLFKLSDAQLYGDLKEVEDKRYPNYLSGVGYLTPRIIMQYVGTEFGRKLDPNIWARKLYNEIADYYLYADMSRHKYVVSDFRFLNEYTVGLENKNSKNWLIRPIKISRDIERSEDVHPSEIELDTFDGWAGEINNNSTKEDLFKEFVCLDYELDK